MSESRVAATPESVKKFIGLGATVAVEAGAGIGASISDADFESAGASVASRADILKDADVILCVQGPEPASLAGVKQGQELAFSGISFAGFSLRWFWPPSRFF